MDPIRNKMAEVMRNAARKALADLDPKSQISKALHEAGLECILGEDIRRICEAMNFFEITRAVALAAQLGMAPPGKKESIKQELKKIAEKAAERAESRGAKLHIPDCCREFLFQL